MLDGPDVIEAELVGEPALLEGIRVHLVLGDLAERTRNGQLEEDAELHPVTLTTGRRLTPIERRRRED
jgi:hypothetical protein